MDQKIVATEYKGVDQNHQRGKTIQSLERFREIQTGGQSSKLKTHLKKKNIVTDHHHQTNVSTVSDAPPNGGNRLP